MQLGRHENNLDLIRFVAATLVLFSHAYPLSGLNPEPIVALTGYESGGALGVATFFVISGYLVAASYLRANDPWKYARNRLLRICPGLFAVVAMAVFFLGPVVSTLPPAAYFSNATTWRYLANAVMAINHDLPGVFRGNPFPGAVNGSLWTLPYEMAMYVWLGLLGVFGLLRCRTLVAAGVLLGLALAVAIHYEWLLLPRILGLADANQFFKLGYFFFSGTALYLASERIRYDWRIAGLLAGLLALTCGRQIGWVVYLLVWPYLVLFLAQIPSRHSRNFGKHGDFSYGMYIYAFPVQQLLIWAYPWSNVYLYALAAFAVTLPLAVVSWYMIEEPALRLKRKPRLADLATVV
ncbi:Sugar acetylase [Candidatus Accumulibacter aalborgensis]|uniref:Sugar acetylase n=1 Tax=Candidatus Accumulibacter aalborgensis TaxID=1860102 RepID=A0A1A8XWA6_9PROT|nr:acyltransferase [Candidatus Accumulibacter aalborgensis]SBT09295.1 Sugar acetylase [Candidatus Accumulibacter aalborgensis]